MPTSQVVEKWNALGVASTTTTQENAGQAATTMARLVI